MRTVLTFVLVLLWSALAMGASPPDKVVLAMVMLKEASLPSAESLLQYAARQWPDMPRLNKLKREKDIISFDVEGGFGAIALMPVPIPWSDLEGPCSTAWYWPGACEAVNAHKAHVIVSLSSTRLDSVEANMLLTKLVASVVHATKAIGIYWGAGTVVHSREGFLEHSRDMTRNNLPLHLWIDFRIYPEKPQRYTLFTTGLKAFGHMEIEMIKAKVNPKSLYGLAYGLAQYLIERGSIINDGDTIGLTADQKIKVRHAPSMWNEKRLVYKLAF